MSLGEAFQRWARIQFGEQDKISTINNFAYCQSDSDEIEMRLYSGILWIR